MVIPEGVTAMVCHYRTARKPGRRRRLLLPMHEIKAEGLILDPRGGYTECELIRDGEVVATGISRCRSEAFVRRFGHDRALGLALQALDHLDHPRPARPRRFGVMLEGIPLEHLLAAFGGRSGLPVTPRP
jgi:hypothetical protein